MLRTSAVQNDEFIDDVKIFRRFSEVPSLTLNSSA